MRNRGSTSGKVEKESGRVRSSEPKPMHLVWFCGCLPKASPHHLTCTFKEVVVSLQLTSRFLDEMNGQPYARLNNSHGPKRQLLGNQAGHAAPAWKTNVPPQASGGKGKQAMDQGSKIFLTRLPIDVGETEVEVCRVELG